VALQALAMLSAQTSDCSLFVWLVADGWCWFVLREKYCWLVAGGWFVLREKYCWLVADKPSEQGTALQIAQFSSRNQGVSTNLCVQPLLHGGCTLLLDNHKFACKSKAISFFLTKNYRLPSNGVSFSTNGEMLNQQFGC
jgi:hypothetical protein